MAGKPKLKWVFELKTNKIICFQNIEVGKWENKKQIGMEVDKIYGNKVGDELYNF